MEVEGLELLELSLLQQVEMLIPVVAEEAEVLTIHHYLAVVEQQEVPV